MLTVSTCHMLCILQHFHDLASFAEASKLSFRIRLLAGQHMRQYKGSGPRRKVVHGPLLCAGKAFLRGRAAWTPPQPGWHMGEHLWAAHTPVVGQVTLRGHRGADEGLSAADGLENAIQYMKQEVDDAQRIAQMMAVRNHPPSWQQMGKSLSSTAASEFADAQSIAL